MKYIFLFLIIAILVFIGMRRQTLEKFVDKKDDTNKPQKLKTIEMLDNQEVLGEFTNGDINEIIKFELGKIKFEFNYKDVKKGFTMNLNNKPIYTPLVLQKDVSYEYKLVIFPIENLMFILFRNKKDKDFKLIFTLHNSLVSNKTAQDLIYLNGNKSIKYGSVKVQKTGLVLNSASNELFRILDKDKKMCLNVEGGKVALLKKEDVGDKKGVLWNIERHGSYYTIRSIINNLYLSMRGNNLVLDNKKDNSIRYYVIDNKNNYIISHLGRVLKLESLDQNDLMGNIVLEKVDNIGQWLTYGSAVNIINNENQYLSGNMNRKYEKTGLFSVYTDDLGEKNLIQWTIEDYMNRKNGYYVKEGDEVYLKNNGMYLQIIKGNYSPNRLGLEVSLGGGKNDNSKWVVTKKDGTDRFFRRGLNVYLYHPKMEVYLYSTGKKFILVGSEKIEIVGDDKRNDRAVWKLDTVSLDNNKLLDTGKVDFYKYTNDNQYFKKKEQEWKQMLIKENEEIKAQLGSYTRLENREKEIISKISETNENIKKILSEKCPATKICVNPIDVSCVPNKKKEEDKKKEKEGLYNVVYIKDTDVKSNPYYINSNKVKECKVLKDFDIKQSPLVKNKKYVAREGAKLKITDFDITEFPEGKDLVSIDTIPDDAKITDFKIEQLPGFEKLELKVKK